jgi:hypothetical protein
MCTALDLSILNGMCKGDLEGRYTYMSESGCSVNDYFIFSNDLLASVYDSCELSICERIESDHLPVIVRVVFPSENMLIVDRQEQDQFIQKFVWNDDYANLFKEALFQEKCRSKLDTAMRLLDVDENDALIMFNEYIIESAECMKKCVSVNNNKKVSDWFDQECAVSKKNVRKLLRISRRSLKAVDQNSYVIARREYKNLQKRKKKQFNKSLVDKLVSSIKCQKDFWDTVHKVSFRRKQPKNNISIDTWFQHFKSLLETNVNDSFNEDLLDEEDEGYMNRPISEEEVLFAFRKLKPRKAAGPDGIIGELLKNSSDQVLQFFIKLFNNLFDKGQFPRNWTESIILPLFKKGDINNPSNYRGISLSDISNKLYSIIINNRLQEWVEEHNITGDYQAGFRKGYSTVDHMFTLLALVQKQFSRNRKLYVAFIDFEKAFDSINRNLLWPILLKNGIKGKLHRCIRSMYNIVKSRIRSGAKFTEYINCTAGVKQGDACSPVLFSIFINELAIEVIKNGRHGAILSNDAFELFILLLADDVILMSETVIGLQTQLNSLQRAAASLQLTVNMSKSNIIVFRKGGFLAARERWIYDGVVMPVVNVYKYLGILFSTRLSFVAACKDLACRAKNALLCVMQKLYILNNNSFDVFMKLFDSQIQPIVQYGSELWGLDKSVVHCESIHLFALKKFLGVNMRTPNDLVYGETNRYPIYVNSAVKCVRFWLRLLEMEDNRIPHKAYKMLLDLDARGKQNWVSKIRLCLNENGFGFVWLNQGVGSINDFISVFRQRLVDTRWQNWNNHIQNSDRFNLYKMFCTTHDLKLYLRLDINRHLKYLLTRFRMGISDITVHRFRYKACKDSDLLCPLCHESKEDEVHFVLCCSVLQTIREQFIPPKYYNHPSLFRLTLLMSSSNTKVVRNVSLFVYKALKFRDVATS